MYLFLVFHACYPGLWKYSHQNVWRHTEKVTQDDGNGTHNVDQGECDWLTISLPLVWKRRSTLELQKWLEIHFWGTFGFQRQGSVWGQGPPQRAHVCWNFWSRWLSRGRREGRHRALSWGRRLICPWKQRFGAWRPLLLQHQILQHLSRLLHLDGVCRLGARSESRIERRSREGNRSGGDGWSHWLFVWKPHWVPASHWRRKKQRRDSVVGQVTLAHRQDRLPISGLWRLEAGVRSAGLTGEHGLQSLDINTLLLTTSTSSTAARFKAGNQQCSKACPCAHCAILYVRLYVVRTHPVKIGFLVPLFLSLPAQNVQGLHKSTFMDAKLFGNRQILCICCTKTMGFKVWLTPLEKEWL